MKSYHIYFNEQCLFKNLSESEFDIIWKKMYHSYFGEQISFVEVSENPTYQLQEHSY